MGNGTEDGDKSGCAGGAIQDDDDDDNWVVECSDDESYNPAGLPGPAWEPRPEVAKLLYERLSRGEPFTLEWLCPGRRSPSPERPEDDEEDLLEEPEETKQEERTLPSGFDFDEDLDAPGMKPTSFTPRRTTASGQTPRTKKRVARMDKIMNDILRHKKIEAAERKATPGRRLHGTPGGGQRKISALSTQRRRLLALSSERKLHGLASSAGGGDKSFNFGDEDDFAASVKKPVISSGVAGGIANVVPGPAEAQAETKMATTPTPVPVKEPTAVPRSIENTIPTAKTEVFEPLPVTAPVLTSGLQSSAVSYVQAAPADTTIPTTKSSQSLSSQMGGLTCKPNTEIKKEPQGEGDTHISTVSSSQLCSITTPTITQAKAPAVTLAPVPAPTTAPAAAPALAPPLASALALAPPLASAPPATQPTPPLTPMVEVKTEPDLVEPLMPPVKAPTPNPTPNPTPTLNPTPTQISVRDTKPVAPPTTATTATTTTITTTTRTITPTPPGGEGVKLEPGCVTTDNPVTSQVDKMEVADIGAAPPAPDTSQT